MTLLNRVWERFPKFYGSPEFVDGVLVGLTGLAIQVVLLSILAPGMYLIFRHYSTRSLRAQAQFYFMRVHVKTIDLFLDMGSIRSYREALPILLKEYEKHPASKVFRDGFNYSIEQRLLVLSRLLADKDVYLKNLNEKVKDDFQKYGDICRECDDDIERLSILGCFPQIQLDLFRVRELLGPIIEVLDDAAKNDEPKGLRAFGSGRLVEIAIVVTAFIERDYPKRDKLIASVKRIGEILEVAPLLLKLSYVLVRRFLGKMICRIQEKPYRDFLSLYTFPDDIREWRERSNLSLKEAANEFDMPVKEYRGYEYGYEVPASELRVRLANRIHRKADAVGSTSPPVK